MWKKSRDLQEGMCHGSVSSWTKGEDVIIPAVQKNFLNEKFKADTSSEWLVIFMAYRTL